MGVVASSKSDMVFENPPQGVHQAVCVDVVDMGMVENTIYQKTQHKIRIVWQIAEKMADGRRFIANRRFTVSLAEQSALRPFLEGWRGRPFSAEELQGFDTDALIGVNCMVQIMHNVNGDNTYANVTAAFPLVKGAQPIKPEGYIRVQDRDKPQTTQPARPTQPPKPPPSQWTTSQPISDDDVPF